MAKAVKLWKETEEYIFVTFGGNRFW
jgi:hypothetical protein